jgi:hypothetical protein
LTRSAVLAAVLFFEASLSVADGGRVRLRQDAGRFAITIFTAPEPLTAGPADISVLVQDRMSGDVVLDAPVEIRLRPPDGARTLAYAAAPGRNRLLRQATVEFPSAGPWTIEAAVRHGAEDATVSTTLTVEPPRSRARSVWPYLAAPPIAVALFAVTYARKRRRR